MHSTAGRTRLRSPPPSNRNPVPLAGGHGADREDSRAGDSFTRNPLRLQYLARTLHRLGARAVFEFLSETLRDPAGDLVGRLEAYAALSPDQLRVTGGDQFPPTLFAVEVDQ